MKTSSDRIAVSVWVALIVSLHQWCGPSHVPWFVVAVIVLAIKAMSWRWTSADIGQKPRKVVHPFIADADAATTIQIEKLSPRVIATSLHFLPRQILRRFRSDASIRIAVSEVAGCSKLTPKATATKSVLAMEVDDANLAVYSAVTVASRQLSPIFARLNLHFLKNSQPSEACADYLDFGWHDAILPDGSLL